MREHVSLTLLLTIISTVTRRLPIDPKMISKFKLGHSVHVRMIFGDTNKIEAPLATSKSEGPKMRYPRKLVFQLYLLFGHMFRQKRGLNGIYHESPIYGAHFKKRIRSLDPRGPI